MIENVRRDNREEQITWSDALQELRNSFAYQVAQLTALRALIPALMAHTNTFSQAQIDRMSVGEYKLKITYDVSTIVVLSMFLSVIHPQEVALLFVLSVGGRVGLATFLFNILSITDESESSTQD